MINLVNLETAQLEQAPLSRTFGLQDMYRDFEASDPELQHHVEKRLSVLESEAAKILARARKAFNEGKGEVMMKREERDLLRRFLFIMLYRNKGFYGRFNLSKEDYKSNDRAQMMEYMEEKGFEKPIDVWFSNIKAFLDVKIEKDPFSWIENIKEMAFPLDGMWFWKNITMFFLTFCTPEEPDDEFLLSENSYSVFEGLNSNGVWTDFHLFAPVTPKLMIVLRSTILPSGADDQNPAILKMLEETLAMHNPIQGINQQRPALEALPVQKARNNYSRVVNGKAEPLNVNVRDNNHKFFFRFFPINTKYTQLINTIFLENAISTTLILYRSSEGLKRALEEYLGTSRAGFKLVSLPRNNMSVENLQFSDRLPYLEKLMQVAAGLGSTVKLSYSDPLAEFEAMREMMMIQRFREMMMSMGNTPSYAPRFEPCEDPE